MPNNATQRHEETKAQRQNAESQRRKGTEKNYLVSLRFYVSATQRFVFAPSFLRVFVLHLFFFMLSLKHLCIADEQECFRRIQAHLVIQDILSAVNEAKESLQKYPDSKLIHEGTIRALSRQGDEKALLQTWDLYRKKFPEALQNREILEEISWGVLTKAFHSSSLVMRQMGLLAAFFSEDARGVTLLQKGLQDGNHAIRAIAVKMAGHFRDQKLIDEIRKLYKEEKVWSVRQEILEAIGSMKIRALESELKGLIASHESHPSEKALATASLLEMMDMLPRHELEHLIASDRYGLRQLACQAIAYFQSDRDIDQLLFLAKDSHPDVRFLAYQSMGQLRSNEKKEEILSIAQEGIHDTNMQVVLSAAWVLTLYGSDEGLKILDDCIKNSKKEISLWAAAALVATGKYGISLMQTHFQKSSDPYVRLNLALGLIRQREFIDDSVAYLSRMIVENNEKWREEEKGLFHIITNSSNKKENPVSTPEIDNQLIRLELLHLLAILKVPQTKEVIRQYLRERSWEISAVASVFLLTEGDDEAAALVEEILQDPDSRIRLRAALILSLWSHEETAIQVLEESYLSQDWESKARIIEGIGRIGSMRSIPFLLEVLKEPSQSLRLIAAAALIQCLNH